MWPEEKAALVLRLAEEETVMTPSEEMEAMEPVAVPMPIEQPPRLTLLQAKPLAELRRWSPSC